MVAQAWKCVRCSQRDLAVYQRAVVEGKSQRMVAAEFKISQPRVSKIIARVKRWLAEPVPEGFDEVPRNRRLYEVSRTHRMRLDALYRKAMEAFEQSSANQHTVKEKKVHDSAKGTTITTTEKLSKTGRPNTRALLDAAKLSEMLVKFEGFDPRGAVDPGNEGRMHEEPEVTSEEAWLELARRVRLWERATGRGEERGSGRGGEGENSHGVKSNGAESQTSPTPPLSPSPTPSKPDDTKTTAEHTGALLSPTPGLSPPTPATETNCVAKTTDAPGLSTLSSYQPITPPVTIPAPKPRPKEIGEAQPGPLVYDAKLMKYFPPAPYGYHRSGNRCWPIPWQKINDNPLPRRQRHEVSLPNYFELNERTQRWEGR